MVQTKEFSTIKYLIADNFFLPGRYCYKAPPPSFIQYGNGLELATVSPGNRGVSRTWGHRQGQTILKTALRVYWLILF